MNIRKTLRGAGWVALQRRGYKVEDKAGIGILPGARLRVASHDGERFVVAVRTSQKRSVAFSYDDSAKQWRTLSGVDQVLVCVRSSEVGSAEVFSIRADVVRKILDESRANLRGKDSSKRNSKLLVVVPLDPPREGMRGKQSDALATKSDWVVTVPFAQVREGERDGTLRLIAETRSAHEDYIEAARQEFAKRNGIDEDRVTVTFQVGPQKIP